MFLKYIILLAGKFDFIYFMKTANFKDIIKEETWVGLGIAGNQAEHLEQAGEADDFKDVVALANAPKGMFPWYIPTSNSFLATNPLSHDRLFVGDKTKLQPEPEIGLVVQFDYTTEATIRDINVIGFTAFNDCSNRINAEKISHKKNWGENTQGMAEEIILVDDFKQAGGSIDSWRLCCYLKRSGELIQYGEDTAVSDYCYFNSTLTEWIINQINTQQDQGPLEAIGTMIAETKPSYGVIGIGATCSHRLW